MSEAVFDVVRSGLKALRTRLRDARRTVDGLASSAAAVDAQLRGLRAARGEVAERLCRLDSLEAVLDPAALAAHLGAAVGGAVTRAQPVRHARVASVLPPGVHAIAAAAAIPPRDCFRTLADGRMEWAPRTGVAPLHALVFWDVLSEGIGAVLGPGLHRLLIPAPSHHAPVAASRARLLILPPGATLPREPRRQDAVTVLLPLAGPAAGGNEAIAVTHPEGVFTDLSPASDADAERCIYEVRIAPAASAAVDEAFL